MTVWNNPVKNILQSILIIFLLSSGGLKRARSSEVRIQARSTTRSLWCNFDGLNNHWQWVQFPGNILSRSRWKNMEYKNLFLLESDWTTHHLFNWCKKEKKTGEKDPLTASDFVSFQSACIRFITFVSLHLVDASRVRRHWYEGRLSCDYDIFLGALSSHSISLG